MRLSCARRVVDIYERSTAFRILLAIFVYFTITKFYYLYGLRNMLFKNREHVKSCKWKRYMSKPEIQKVVHGSGPGRHQRCGMQLQATESRNNIISTCHLLADGRRTSGRILRVRQLSSFRPFDRRRTFDRMYRMVRHRAHALLPSLADFD